MNILYLQTTLENTCGVTRYIRLITDNLPEKYNSFIITFGGNAANRMKREGYNITIFNKTGIPVIGSLLFLFFLYRFCRKNRIDIIHNNHRYFDTLTGLFSLFLPPAIMTVHSFTRGKKYLSYKSKELIAVSKAVKRHLENEYSRDGDNISVINNFVDENNIRTSIPASSLKSGLKIPEDHKTLFFAGRMNRIKGVDVIMEAFETVSKKYKKIFLLMAGDGPESENLAEYAQEKKLPLRIIPSVENIYDYYNIADIILIPSREDPFPYVMLEAGFTGNFIIASDTGGIPELIENKKNGLLCMPGDPESLSEAMIYALENPEETEKMAHALYEKVKRNYTPGNIIPSYIAIYEKYKKG